MKTYFSAPQHIHHSIPGRYCEQSIWALWHCAVVTRFSFKPKWHGCGNYAVYLFDQLYECERAIFYPKVDGTFTNQQEWEFKVFMALKKPIYLIFQNYSIEPSIILNSETLTIGG